MSQYCVLKIISFRYDCNLSKLYSNELGKSSSGKIKISKDLICMGVRTLALSH
jgi:hypothetical protein